MFFKILKKSPDTRAASGRRGTGQAKNSRARLGRIYTAHGTINTPCFMPIATRGAVKNLAPCELESLGAEIILGNTYHLFLRPGEKLVKKAGGLHKFINWRKPILTDSGGFQVFSLAKLRKISERGVEFCSPIDGAKHFLSPEKSMQIQLDLGADMIMAFDECTPYPATREYTRKSLELTSKWAERCKRYFDKSQITINKSQTNYKLQINPPKSPFSKGGSGDLIKFQKHFLFGIIQGSTFKDLREESAKQIVGLDTDGVAIGGVSVGEPPEKMLEALDWVAPYLPEEKPHYLMGVGYPEQIVEAVKRGIDMFDCVIPSRNGRHGELFVWDKKIPLLTSPIRGGKGGVNFYSSIHITNKKFTRDFGPIDKTCGCELCQNFSRAYLRHLFMTRENLGLRLATIHNLAFYMELMRRIRENI